MDEREIKERLNGMFHTEAAQHIAAISQGFIDLERRPEQYELVEKIYREMHSLKGASRSVDRNDIAQLCQAFESVLAAWKRKEFTPSPELFDLYHRAITGIESLIKGEGSRAAQVKMAKDLIQELGAVVKQPVQKRPSAEPPAGLPVSLAARNNRKKPAVPVEQPDISEPPAPPAALGPVEQPPPYPVPESVRVSKRAIDSLVLQAEDLAFARISAGQRVSELADLSAGFLAAKQEWVVFRNNARALRRHLKQLDQDALDSEMRALLEKIFDLVDRFEDRLYPLEAEVGRMERKLAAEHHLLMEKTQHHLEDIKDLMMVPVASAMEGFPRVVREFAREAGIEADLEIEGGDTLLDRRILEEMKDPFLHMIRNCVDHGIERPEDRIARGKNRKGRILISASHRDAHTAEIRVGDDGAGIPLDKVRDAAVRISLLSRDEADGLSDAQINRLIFRSGITTSRIVTDTSGRGLGLAIVQERVERLGGTISVFADAGKGTQFIITLPLTLAVFNGLFVEAGGRSYVLPLNALDQVLQYPRSALRTVENRVTADIGGEILPVLRLTDILHVTSPKGMENTRGSVTLAIAGFSDNRIAIEVDTVSHVQDILVKGLGPQLKRVRTISGATILGSGSVVPILSIPDLIKSTGRLSDKGREAEWAGEEPALGRKLRVLVAEDSITSRMLLRSILDGAGYDVETAVDGIDALAKIRSHGYDILVSDVDMPGLNGFLLTERIRADRNLAGLPVVLVTALDSPQDRLRGADAGANAYIVKSSFDQSNLLEVVRTLLGDAGS